MSNARNHIAWNKRLEGLKKYVDENGHSLVPRSYITEEGFKLGVWVSEQRKRRAHHSESERLELESLPGWLWDASAWREIRSYNWSLGVAVTSVSDSSKKDTK